MTSELLITSEWHFRGLKTIIFENRILRVIVLPELGGKIWQIVYKPLDEQLLWNNPRVKPGIQPIGARYDDVWAGGWDELFPNDEGAAINGETYPDHGEFWTGAWDAVPFLTEQAVGIELSFTTPISNVNVHKTISLERGLGRLEITHHLRNLGKTPLPFLWKLHPAFAVTPQHQLILPATHVVMEPAFTGTLASAPPQFNWPFCPLSDGTRDLRLVPSFDQGQMYFFYGTELREGFCGILNTASGLSCELRFDPAVFSSCWLFASYGGWRNHEVAVLEPCTGYPLDFKTMEKEGRARVLAPNDCLSTSVSLSVEQRVDLRRA